MPKKATRYKFRIKNGSVEIRAILIKGQPPKYFTGKTYEEAEAKADEALRLAEKDIVTDRADWGNRPLGEWLDYWLNSVRRPQLQPTTYEKYEHQIRLYLKPHPLAGMTLQQIRYGDVEVWRDWLETAPSLATVARRAVRRPDYQGVIEPKSLQDFTRLAKRAGTVEPLSALTRLDIFQRLSTALRFAVKRRYIEFNPCDTVSRPSHDKSRRKPAPRAEQISRLLRQIESERWGTAVVIAVSAGLRKGEVLALKWEDIEWTVENFPAFGEVNIARQIQRLGRGVGLLVREIPKSEASDAIRPLPPVALAALERRRKEQTTEMLRAPKLEPGTAPSEDDRVSWRGGDVRPGKTGFIFTTEVGTPIDPRNFDRWFAAQCSKSRLPKGYTFHRLRHDYASILLKKNVASRVAQEMVRHAQYSTTASIYQHVSTDDMFAAAQAVQDWLEEALSR
jgi:integrase